MPGGDAKLTGAMGRARPAILATLLLTACGGGATTTPTACATPAPPPPPSAAAAPVTAVGSTARVDPGGTVTFTVTASGPAQVHFGDCSAPLSLFVTDSGDQRVYAGQSVALSDPSRCPAATLAAGQTLSEQVDWPVDPSLPGGVYQAALVLGDAPQLTLSIAVGRVSC